MTRSSNALLRSSFAAAAVFTVTVASVPASAELIELTNGQSLAGRVVDETASELRFSTATPSGRREMRLPRGEVSAVYRGAAELSRIDRCADADRLVEWCAGYLGGDLEMPAQRALNRALRLNDRLAHRPRSASNTKDAEDSSWQRVYVRFWNATALRYLKRGVGHRDAGAMLRLARWAHDADMDSQAALFLRRARSLDRQNKEIPALAASWGVRLEGWVWIDLSPVFDQPLIGERLRDAGILVTSASGRTFLTLPVRYDLDALEDSGDLTERRLWKNSVRGDAFKAFYGLRHLVMKDDVFHFESSDTEPVFEELQFARGDGDRLMVQLRNRLAARPSPDGATPSDRSRRPPRQKPVRETPINVRASGWAAFVFEIPGNAPSFRIEWAEGGEETIDLDFLRAAAATSPRQIVDQLPPPAPTDRRSGAAAGGWETISPISESLSRLRHPSPSVVALAIERLARIRRGVFERAGADVRGWLDAWARVADSAVIEAVRRSETVIHLAAWRYFNLCPPGGSVTPVTLLTSKKLASAEADVHREWVRTIAYGAGQDDCGEPWRRVASDWAARARRPKVGSFDPSDGVRVLGRLLEATLHSDDADVCAEALDLLIALGPPATDWRFLPEASAAAQRQAVVVLSEIADADSQARLLKALMLSARPETAPEVAALAGLMDFQVRDAEGELLVQWPAIKQPDLRRAFLTVLQGIPLRQSIYSSRFDAVIREAVESGGGLRDAAWQLLISQLELRNENRAAAADPGEAVHGPFPMMVSRRSNDPLIQGVRAAGRWPEGPWRIDAVAALIRAGYAEEAANCLLHGVGNRRLPDRETLRQIGATCLTHHRDALCAFYGYLLKPEASDLAPVVLEALTALVSMTPEDRQWRIGAALKAGIHFGLLAELVVDLSPTAANSLSRWLAVLGHMTPQDRQRWDKADTVVARRDRLERINLRRGQRLDGRYGMLAVVATTAWSGPVPGDQAPRHSFRQLVPKTDLPDWAQPIRTTIELPPTQISTRLSDNTFRVTIGNDAIGAGRIMQQSLPLRAPAAYFPFLASSHDWWRLAGFHPAEGYFGQTDDSSGGSNAPGPLRLPSFRVETSPVPGTLTLDVGPVLRDVFASRGLFSEDSPEKLVPEEFLVTLRYGPFGCFAGCGADRTPPAPNEARGDADRTHRFLLNVMIVLERID